MFSMCLLYVYLFIVPVCLLLSFLLYLLSLANKNIYIYSLTRMYLLTPATPLAPCDCVTVTFYLLT